MTPTFQSTTYDSTYDPLVQSKPGCGQEYAPTYWLGTAGEFPEDDGPIVADVSTDVVIIGSGYTGLSCAIHLAKEHNIKALVLEANSVAWGCSTRNGGQAQFSSGRLKRSQWIKRWGVDVAKKMHGEMMEAFELFNALVQEEDIDCDPQTGGHYYIAHRPSVMQGLKNEVSLLRKVFGYNAQIISKEELQAEHVNDREAAGAMWEEDGTGIHAAKLAFGYQKLARKLGAKIHTSSPVLEWKQTAGKHYLRTPGGTVAAKAVAVATGGYTSGELSPLTKHRLMPILSNSIVTRQLTKEELQSCGIYVRSPLTDTRTLRHYYRLLPDNRVQIGSRSAIKGVGAPDQKHLDLLKTGLYRKFPDLQDVELSYSWWGWVDVSHDMMPRIFQPDESQMVYYSLGYGGNGVMYSAQAGRRLAQLVAGKKKGLTLPIFQSPLPHYGVLTPFRRMGQRMSYVWYYLKDEVL